MKAGLDTQPLYRYSMRTSLLVVAVFAVLFAALAEYGLRGVQVFCWMAALVCIVLSVWDARFQIAVVLAMAIGVVSIPLVVMEGHPVRLARLAKVNQGMTHDQVIRLLGRPRSTKKHDAGDFWIYSGGTWCMVKIAFSPAGLVTTVEHDH